MVVNSHAKAMASNEVFDSKLTAQWPPDKSEEIFDTKLTVMWPPDGLGKVSYTNLTIHQTQ